MVIRCCIGFMDCGIWGLRNCIRKCSCRKNVPPRIIDTAILDYFIAIFFAMFVTYMTKIPLVLTTIGVLIFGIIMHYLFGVETNTLKYLGISC